MASKTKKQPLTFEEVLEDELQALGKLDDNPHDKGEEHNQYARAHLAQLVGLALSGGGIRSATFNLGVLQALAKYGLLRKFDYLSTVSGGGVHRKLALRLDSVAGYRSGRGATEA